MVGIREGHQRPSCPSVRPTLTHQISRIVTRCPVLSGLSGSRGGTRLGLHMLCHPRPAQPGPVGPSPPPCVKPGLTGLTGRTGKTWPILSLLTKPDNIASTILPIICHHLVPPATSAVWYCPGPPHLDSSMILIVKIVFFLIPILQAVISSCPCRGRLAGRIGSHGLPVSHPSSP